MNHLRQYTCILRQYAINGSYLRLMSTPTKEEKPLSPRLQEFKKKLLETAPAQEMEVVSGNQTAEEEETLEAWPNNTNPHTGEIGGPRGPEPTRYGDWERKGRVSDF